MANIDLSYVYAARVLVTLGETVNLALVGCGGTGSWLASSVVRVAKLVRERYTKKVTVFFVDPDIVEAKNVYRQNFCDAEVGRPKATALAWRYGMAWGVDVQPVQEAFNALKTNYLDGHTVILLGCVDRASGRRELARFTEHRNRWWIDCGNFQAAGQVLVGRGGSEKKPFELPGLCSWLPAPDRQHPELLVDEVPIVNAGGDEGPRPGGEGLSCADMAMLDSQGLAINQRVAAEASDYLVRLLLTHDLRKMATYIDLPSGATRSIYITPENVKERCHEHSAS
jgi:PRTRC genetic system ThiF family protein